MFPKVIIISKNIQITPQKENLLTIVHDINLLNYYNVVTGIPMSYNIFVQNMTISITKTKFLIPVEEQKTQLIVKLIEENKLDTNDRKSIAINFKVYPDTQIINVVYVSFEDVLGAFGGFFSTFSLLAAVLSDLVYNDFFYKINTVNSVFKIKNVVRSNKVLQRNKAKPLKEVNDYNLTT